MQITFLKENPDFIQVIAQWYFAQWGYLSEGNSVEKIARELLKYCNESKMPMMLCAHEHGSLLGTAQLKFREMAIYPEREHWLGGVYVDEKFRGQGIAAKVIAAIESQALRFSVETLYLQTENLTGGLYKRLGWEPLEQVNYRGSVVLVMEKKLRENE